MSLIIHTSSSNGQSCMPSKKPDPVTSSSNGQSCMPSEKPDPVTSATGALSCERPDPVTSDTREPSLVRSVPVTSFTSVSSPVRPVPVTLDTSVPSPVRSVPVTSDTRASSPVRSVPVTSDTSTSSSVRSVPVTSDTRASSPVRQVPVTSDTSMSSPVRSVSVTSDTRASSPVRSVPVTSDTRALSPMTSDITEWSPMTSDNKIPSPASSESRILSSVTADNRKRSPVTSYNSRPSPVTSDSRDELLQTDTDYDTDAYSLENILRHYWLLSDREDDGSSVSTSAHRDASSSFVRKDNTKKWTAGHNQRQSSHDRLATIHQMMFDDDDVSNKTLSTISEEDVNELIESFDTYSSSVDPPMNKNTQARIEQSNVVSPHDDDLSIATNPSLLRMDPLNELDFNTSNFRTAFEVNKSCMKSFKGYKSQDKSNEKMSMSANFPVQPETVENDNSLDQTLLPSWRYAVVRSPQSRPRLSKRVEVSSTLTSRALDNISRSYFSDYYPYMVNLIEHRPRNSSSDDDDSSEDEFLSIVSSQCSFKSPNCTSCDVTSFDAANCDGNENDGSGFELDILRNDTVAVESKQPSLNNNIEYNNNVMQVPNDSGCCMNKQDIGNQAVVSGHIVNDLSGNEVPSEAMSVSLANEKINENSDALDSSKKTFNGLFCAHSKTAAVARFLESLPKKESETILTPNDVADTASLPNDIADNTPLPNDTEGTSTCTTSYVNVNANGSNDFLAISSSAINAAKLATFKLLQVSDAGRHESHDIEVVLTTTCILRRNEAELIDQDHHDSCHSMFDDSAYESSKNNVAAADKYVYKKAPRMKDLLKRVNRNEDSNTSFMTLEYSDIRVSADEIENYSTNSTVLSDISDMTYLHESNDRHSSNKSYDFIMEDICSKHKSVDESASEVSKNDFVCLEPSEEMTVMHGGETRVRTLIRQNANNNRRSKLKVNIAQANSPVLKCKALEVSFGDTSMESDDFGEHYYADVSEMLDEIVYTKPIHASSSKRTTYAEPNGASCLAGITDTTPVCVRNGEGISFTKSIGACPDENCNENIAHSKPVRKDEEILSTKFIDTNNDEEFFYYDNYSKVAFLHPMPIKVNESNVNNNYNHNHFSNFEKLKKFCNEKDGMPHNFVNDTGNTHTGLQRNGRASSLSSSDTLDTFISVPSSSVASASDSRCSFEFYEVSPGQKRKSISNSQGSRETLKKSPKENHRKFRFSQSNGSKIAENVSGLGRHLSGEAPSSVTKEGNGQILSRLSEEFSDASFRSNNISIRDTRSMFPDDMMDSILGITAIMSLTNGLSRMKTCKDNVSNRTLHKSSVIDIIQNTSTTDQVPEISFSDARSLDKLMPEEVEDVPGSPTYLVNEPKPIQKQKHAHLRKVKHMFRIFHLGHDDRDKKTSALKEKKPKEK